MIVSGILNSGCERSGGAGTENRAETVELQARNFYKKVAKNP